jgi:hypothetical protein
MHVLYKGIFNCYIKKSIFYILLKRLEFSLLPRYLNVKHLLSLFFFRKRVIKIAFLVMHDSVWKVDNLFKKMMSDPCFDPVIIVTPFISYGENNMFNQMDVTYRFFEEKKYPVIKSYDHKKNQWISFSKQINPDAVFFTNPHPITYDIFYKNIFSKYISYYVPYYYQISKHDNYKMQYDQLFHNSVWKIFSPHRVAFEIHKKFSSNKGSNVELVGYPGTENLIKSKVDKHEEVWKSQSCRKLRIIWAPHHTIDSPDLPYSNFIKYANFFKKIAHEYSTLIQWAFKPHPILMQKLINHPDWGLEKTLDYWNFWSESEFSQLEESDYSSLFKTSDAMIHDSGSFLVEYFFTGKPVMYLVSNELIKDYFNELGSQAFDNCYHGNNKDDIYRFIKSLLSGNDEMQISRNIFFQKEIAPYYQFCMPSSRILNSIKKDFGLLDERN